MALLSVVKNDGMANQRHFIIAGALSAVACAWPAVAQSSSMTIGLSKTEAIIGGQSSLAAVLSQQGFAPPTKSISPAGYGLNRAVPRVPTSVRQRLTISTSRPDVFGTVALRVRQTRLDERWLRVSAAKVSGTAATFALSLRRLDETSRLDAVNRYVNRRVQFTDDHRQYGKGDVWTNANATLNRGRGDCEDYAIAKLQMLRVAGFSDRDLYFVILKDLVRRSDHAVLVVRSDDRMVVLDNGTDQIVDSESVSDYRPVLTFAATGTWTHGYRVPQTGVDYASAASARTDIAPAANRN